MKYDQLKNFILNVMDMRNGENYQPVMIRYLNQNRGKATKKDIQEALHNANLHHPVKYFQPSPVFGVLTDSRNVTRTNSDKTEYELLDYETFTPAQKAHITMYCDEKIRGSKHPINPRVILFSAAGKKSFEHFNETIAEDVITSALPGNTILKDVDAVRAWGSIYNSQNYSKWKELKKGDILLFYHNKKYIASGILEGTEHNQELADHLWGKKDEESKKTFELMVYMLPSLVFNDDVDYQKLNKLLGYEEEFMPTRILDFTTVNKNKTNELIEQHGSLENALNTMGFSFSETEKNNVGDLENLIKQFDKNRNLFRPERESEKEMESIRQEFLKKFPRDNISIMEIEDYVFGSERNDTFCHYIGTKIPGYGSVGRYNEKYCVYWKDSEGRYQQQKKYPDYQTAFTSTKNTISSLLKGGDYLEKDKDWKKMGDVFERSEKNIRTDIKSKILAVYFPKIFLNIHTLANMENILKYFGVPCTDIRKNHILLQEKLLEIKNNHPVMTNWSIQDYGEFLWYAIVEGTLESIPINYVLFRHNPPGKKSHDDRNKWNDVLGHEYEYSKKSGLISAVTPGSKVIWMYTENDEMYFWGHGKIESSEETDKDEFLATMKNFERLGVNNEPKKASASLLKKIQSHKGWNKYNSIIGIDDKIYNEIVNEEAVFEKTFDDKQIHTMTADELKRGLKEISNNLLIPKKKIMEIVNAMVSSHVILAGPIGTGKTELARIIPKVFWSTKGGYFSDIYTATADWNTQDVIGGIVPKMKKNDVIYKIQDGCITESIRKNWLNDGRKSTTIDGHAYCGVWAIIDEFNRADIDKAFGQLFTALRTKEMKISSDHLDRTFDSLKIPKDFRIIGTLNTADKHYLFPLSDALKSRFSIIEIDVPEKKLKDKEIFYALKHAMEHLELKKHYEVILDENKKIVLSRQPYELFPIIYQAYNFLSFVRQFNKLGTAILKIIYQNLLSGHQLKANLNDMLDNSINSTIIPQLEKLSELELGAINAMINGKLLDFLKDVNKTNKRHNSSKVFSKILKFLNLNSNDYEYFTESVLKDDDKLWGEIESSLSKLNLDENKLPSNLEQTSKSLESLMDQSVI
jgi:MoxR-like ATPase